MADRAAVKACVEQVQKELGPVNILVNNAGVIADGLFVRMEPEEWDKVVNDQPGRGVQLLPRVGLSDDAKKGGADY